MTTAEIIHPELTPVRADLRTGGHCIWRPAAATLEIYAADGSQIATGPAGEWLQSRLGTHIASVTILAALLKNTATEVTEIRE